jgi:hypothetical protein
MRPGARRYGMSDAEPASDGTAAAATRVSISYPADLSTWGRQQVDTRHFRAYLRKTMGSVDVGDAVDAFVGVGCCGDSLDVPLVVEAVEGGDRVGPDTEIVYEVREACDIQGGWRVQSEAGPTE